MRQGSNNGRRPRGRTNRKQHGGGGGQSRTHTFDSNGPDGRVRGNARQVYEKYLSLARDASSAGDRIAAEAYYQHAEHYFRILSDSTDPTPSGRRPEDRQPQPYPHDEGYFGDDDEAPVNGHGHAQGHGPSHGQGYAQGQGQGGERQREARGNGNGAPQGQRPMPPQDSAPSDAGQRERAPAAATAPAGEPAGQPQVPAGEGEPSQRPRRGRPRKPRNDDDEQPRQQDGSSDPESGPAIN